MKKKILKLRLDEILVRRGLADTTKDAQALIMAGCVSVNGATSTKAGTACDESIPVSIKESNPYVSRGGLKLQAFLERSGMSVKDMVCLDIGASTGGFTDCLLQRGAKKVYAVDVGKNLLDCRLRNDPRVENMEEINFRHLPQLFLKEKVEFVTIDVSFISLEKILPNAAQCIIPGGKIAAMVKPQFEALPKETVKGVVRDESVRSAVIRKIIDCGSKLGLKLEVEADSAVKGPSGNIEHFILLKK